MILKNNFLGLGIFALIVFLSLVVLGALEVSKPSTDASSFLDSGNQEGRLYPGEKALFDWVLLNRTETNEYEHAVRKFPVLSGFLFYIINQNVAEKPVLLSHISLFVNPFIDLPVFLLNLRI